MPGSYIPWKGLHPWIVKAFFKDAASVVPLGESLYKLPLTSHGTNDTLGIPHKPCFNTQAQAEQTRDKRTETLLPFHEAQR